MRKATELLLGHIYDVISNESKSIKELREDPRKYVLCGIAIPSRGFVILLPCNPESKDWANWMKFEDEE
jgi:hypothetical protein